MAVSEQEKAEAERRFYAAEGEQALTQIDVSEGELLYPVTDEEEIGVYRLPADEGTFDLWAVDRTANRGLGVKIGWQDVYGRLHWETRE